MFFIAAFSGCSAVTNIPTDLKASYITKSELTKYSLSIVIEDDVLRLSYLNNGVVGSGKYSLSNDELKNIYNQMKTSGFLSVPQPEGEQITDMPSQTLFGRYDGKSNSIEFGTVREPASAITNLKQLLIDITAKYNKNFKKVMNLE